MIDRLSKHAESDQSSSVCSCVEDELRIALDAMIEYGRGKGYIGDSGSYALDSMTEEVLKADA